MAGVTRVAISLEPELLEQFDALAEERGYATRSEAIRDLIRARLVEENLRRDTGAAVGVVYLVYDHHQSGLSDKLTHLQHETHEEIVSTLHVHLDAHNCLEILVLRGRAKDIRQIGDQLVATKGVKHGQVVLTAVGKGHA
jgi:CopG family transcriptional regulator, nickel-responsive regulator